MEEDDINQVMYVSEEDDIAILDAPISTLPPNHHPRKLPNIPRNPEIYEPSPGIFKYIRKENRTPVLGATENVTDSPTDCVTADVAISSIPEPVLRYTFETADSKSGSLSKKFSEEMSVELECYDEAAHIVCMSQKIEPETLKGKKAGTSNDNTASKKPDSVATRIVNVAQEPKSRTDNFQNLYRPPKLDDQKSISGLHLPSGTNSDNMQRFLPTDSDDFVTLKSKLNRAMQLYSLQRRQMVKLSAKVKSLTGKNQKLSERARSSNPNNLNKPSPCLATDTKYIIMFENLIRPDAMKTIMTAIATADKPGPK